MRICEYIKDKAGILIGDLSCADSFASGNCHINRLYKTQTFL